MSSAVISTSAAQGRFFVLDAEYASEVCPPSSENQKLVEALRSNLATRFPQSTITNQKSKILSSVTPASRLIVRPSPEMVSSGITAIDALTGGLPRGCLTEIFGPVSSGRTTILLAALAAATRRGEFCAIVDSGDALDPQSAAAARIELDQLLWVRCGENSPPIRAKEKTSEPSFKFRQSGSRHAEHRLEQLLRTTDLLLESGGFGLIALDLCDLPQQTARRVPLTTWFRFRRAVEHTATVLLAIERQAIAGSCSSLLIKLGSMRNQTQNQTKEALNFQIPAPAHAQLLTRLEISAEVVRFRIERKPAGSVSAMFSSKTAWAG